VISDNVWTVIDRCWTRDPLARPLMTEMVHLFEWPTTPPLSPSQQDPHLTDFSRLCNNYLNMLQTNTISNSQDIPVDQQDAVRVLMDARPSEPSQWCQWAVVLSARAVTPEFVDPDLSESLRSLVSPTQSLWDDFSPTPDDWDDYPPTPDDWDDYPPTPDDWDDFPPTPDDSQFLSPWDNFLETP
jgi:hypothetical protein